MAAVSKLAPYEEVVDELIEVGEDLRKRQQRSFIAGVAEFLEAWEQGDEGFVRIISYKASGFNKNFVLEHSCIEKTRNSTSVCGLNR